MELEGSSPNCFTFTSLLAACANLAPLHCGQQVHGGIVGRGLDANSALDNALIRRMLFNSDASVWGALLGACKAHNSPKLGINGSSKDTGLRTKFGWNLCGVVKLLSSRRQMEGVVAARTRKFIMREIWSKKEAGRNWIEIRNQVYSFVVGGKVGSHIELVYLTKRWNY
ncbi:hypothetical protein Tsubulata_046238 [Turnera subulata]|uniref:Uncharacterized protein n=1 Tax=Turnera subulata TaxID=218843 RepID=A0A9Q0JGS2_9ROSI|nr:hypothetical protein Tsubulata_046238 [Turnera subulata]